MTFSKRWLLVLLLSVGQTACLLLGVALFVSWMRGGMASVLHQEFLIVDPGMIDQDTVAQVREDRIQAEITRLIVPVWTVGITVTSALVLLSSLLTVAITRRYENRLAGVNTQLAGLVEHRTRALRKTRDAVIFGLAKLAESRDNDTGTHLERIRLYVTLLARQLAKDHPEVDETYIDNLALASSLHDIGKVGIRDAILLKPGSLTPAERKEMERHAEIGGDCLAAIERRLGEDDFLEMARTIAYFHHERWDGNGYPRGLREEQIPLAARIVALADVYDALTTKRVYKPAMSHFEARTIITSGTGTQFDPELVAAFLRCENEFEHVADQIGSELELDGAAPRPALESPALVTVS